MRERNRYYKMETLHSDILRDTPEDLRYILDQ